MINRVDIAIEVLRAISASAAMIVCAPATALIASKVYTSRTAREEVRNERLKSGKKKK